MRVLHISDLHVFGDPGGRLRGLDTFNSLARVLEHAFAQAQAPDGILVTGDLAQEGSREAYRRIRSLLVPLGCPVYVVPGNHDCVMTMRKELIAESIKMEAFADVDGWHFVFIDSRVQGRTHGSITDDCLIALANNVDERRNRPTLIAFHHSPIVNCLDPGCQLLGAASLLATVQRYDNVRAVLSGHLHHSSMVRLDNIALVSAPATSLQFTHVLDGARTEAGELLNEHVRDTSLHGYRLVDLSPDGSVDSYDEWFWRAPPKTHRARLPKPT
jgi:Icc protein